MAITTRLSALVRQVALATTLTTPLLAQAASPALVNQMGSAQSAYGNQSMIRSHEIAYASLGIDESQVITAQISPNTEYVIHADCVWPCTDVDISVYSDDGEVVANDSGSSRAAVAHINSNGASSVRYTIRMAGCQAFRCEVGAFLMAYAQSTATAPISDSASSSGWTEEDSALALATLATLGVAYLFVEAMGSPSSQTDAEYRAQQERDLDAAMHYAREAEKQAAYW